MQQQTLNIMVLILQELHAMLGTICQIKKQQEAAVVMQNVVKLSQICFAYAFAEISNSFALKKLVQHPLIR